MIELVCFDMAGTTVQDRHEVEACFAAAAHETGLEMTDEEILSVQGQSKRWVFETFWERQTGGRSEVWQQAVDKSFAHFTQILEAHYLTQPVLPTEGCLETFSLLRERGIAIALTTGFYRKVTDIILNRLGWLEGLDANYVGTKHSMIQFSVSSDQVPQGRPAPDMIFRSMEVLGITEAQRIANVGDTPHDIISGQAAGCKYSLCVLNGTHSADLLLPHKPDGALPHLGKLIEYLDSQK